MRSAYQTVVCVTRREKLNMTIKELQDLYDQYNLQAHSAYMQGLSPLASEYYLKAFHTCRAMVSKAGIREAEIERLLEACQNCFEFCHYCAEPECLHQDPAYYLTLAQEDLIEIITGRHALSLRSKALSTYADIAYLAVQTHEIAPQSQALTIADKFHGLWLIHSPLLIDLQ